VGYYQGRQVQQPPHMSVDEGSEQGTERGGTFELSWFSRNEGRKYQYWDGMYWWVGVIDPEEYDIGKQEEEQIRETTTFTDINGSQFTAAEADRQEHALKSVFFKEELLDRYRRRSDTSVEQWSAQGGYLSWQHYYGIRFYRNEHNELYIAAKDLQAIPPDEVRT